MKFEEFYNQVFIAEKDEEVRNNVASPEDFDDVEPLPLPEPTQATSTEDGTTPEGEQSSAPTGGTTLADYVLKINDFADSLNHPENECLNRLVKRLDQPNTPYDGIAGRTSADIVRVAEGLRGIAENLVNFTIAAAAGGK